MLAFALMSQTFAMARSFVGDHGGDLAHAALHLDNTPHHHHDDGSIHHDDSDESLKHVFADGSAGTAVFMPTCVLTVLPAFGRAAAFSIARGAHDSPILEGPRRPPRLTA